MTLHNATIRFPSGDVRTGVVYLTSIPDHVQFSYLCMYCGTKVGLDTQMFCNAACADSFDVLTAEGKLLQIMDVKEGLPDGA